jgi:VWFA-related protein
VVRITTNLVQTDVLVTDKDGNQVTDLSANDFELLQDGKPQKITSFAYINTATSTQPASIVANRNSKTTIVPPPVRVRPGNAGRLITFIVDDGNCAASHQGMIAAEEGLEKFVKEQMQPDDLVAVYQTRSGSSVFQQYTSDKALLLRAISKIRWYPPTGTCALNDGSFSTAASSNTFNRMTPNGMRTVAIESDDERRRREVSEDSTRNNQVVGTIGVLRYALKGLAKVGGRKLVFLLSDGLPLRGRNGEILSARDVLRDVTDLANRASVVINPIDVRGVYSTSIIEARDEVLTKESPNASDNVIATRSADVNTSHEGLFFLADETGGKVYTNNNYLDVPVRRALNLEKGYYLLGYQPDEGTFKGRQFHQIKVKLNRPELRVVSRAGFVGTTEKELRAKPRTGDSELYEALVAPLPKPGLELGLTAFFANTAPQGNFVRALVHLSGRDISFVNGPNGKIKAVFDVVAVTLNEKTAVVDEFNRTHSFIIDEAALPLIKKNGLIYTTDVPIKKAGSYNFRVAVRDGSNKQIGSAGQVIEVPDLSNGNLFLSGLTVSAVDQNGKFVTPSSVTPENALSLTASTSVPAIRQFPRNTILAYAYTLYNAHLDKTTQQPNLSLQLNLYRGGKLISEGAPQPVKLESQADLTRISDYGYLRLKANVEVGDYALQVIVKDLLAKGKNQSASQWIDFEVVP